MLLAGTTLWQQTFRSAGYIWQNAWYGRKYDSPAYASSAAQAQVATMDAGHGAEVVVRPVNILSSVNALRECMPFLGWGKYLESFPTASVSVAITISLLFCIPILSQLALSLLRHLKSKMTSPPLPPLKPFRFLDLPPELRDMVYEYLLEDPYYPPLPTTCQNHKRSVFQTIEAIVSVPYEWIKLASTPPLSATLPPTPPACCCEKKQSNWLLLANKQVYAEFMDILVRKRVFHFTVSPANYTCPTVPATPVPLTVTTTASRASSSQVVLTQPQPLWTISPTTLSHLRRCTLKLITTSPMLGCSDPRTMAAGTWPLAHQIGSQLQHLRTIKELNLHVKAVGDPLWNPLWVWYHATLSFISMGETGAIPGPRLSKISYSLDSWSPGENYLGRNEGGEWEWRCEKGHCVDGEAGRDMAVREFCARLYHECVICRPELGSDEEDGEEQVVVNGIGNNGTGNGVGH